MDEGLRRMIERAEQGDVEYMVMVGDCYNRGLYTEKDEKEAYRYYKMAADKGNAGAEFMVGLSYLYGDGVAKDKKLARQYIRSAADKGVSKAQFVFGIMCLAGEAGFLIGKRTAVEYFEKAARQGLAEAQIKLADAYFLGNGVAKDLDKSVFWMACAYLHGNDAREESQEAVNRFNALLEAGVPGGRTYIDSIIEKVKTNFISYTKES